MTNKPVTAVSEQERAEMFRWKSDCPPRCDMTAEDLYKLMAAYRRESVREALLTAAKRTCHFCAWSKQDIQCVDNRVMHRLSDDEGSGLAECAASGIHAMLAELECARTGRESVPRHQLRSD